VREVIVELQDGTTVVGAPAWSVQASSLKIGEKPEILAFPRTPGFSPEHLIAHILLHEEDSSLPAVPDSTQAAEPLTEDSPPTSSTQWEVSTCETLPSGEIRLELLCPACGRTLQLTLQLSQLDAATP
jgi:hypothetical protein